MASTKFSFSQRCCLKDFKMADMTAILKFFKRYLLFWQQGDSELLAAILFDLIAKMATSMQCSIFIQVSDF